MIPVERYLFFQGGAMANVHDVATYILSKQTGMTTIELENLAYHAPTCSHVSIGEPAFPERIEKWSKGPVVPGLCAQLRPMCIVDEKQGGKPEVRADEQKQTVEAMPFGVVQVGPELQPPSARAARTSS
jgi:uncharacterized phage-associated protein